MDIQFIKDIGTWVAKHPVLVLLVFLLLGTLGIKFGIEVPWFTKEEVKVADEKVEGKVILSQKAQDLRDHREELVQSLEINRYRLASWQSQIAVFKAIQRDRALIGEEQATLDGLERERTLLLQKRQSLMDDLLSHEQPVDPLKTEKEPLHGQDR